MLEGIIATGHSDKSVRVWSGKNYSLIYKFTNCHADEVNSLCINPVTWAIISVGKDHSIKLLDYKEHEILDEIWPDDYVNIKHSSETVAWAAYSQHIVVASANEKILVYSLENKRIEEKRRSTAKKVGRSMSMCSFSEFSENKIIKTWLKFKEMKVIDTTEKLSDDLALCALLNVPPKMRKKEDLINVIRWNPIDDSFITGHASGKIVNWD